MLSDRRQHVLAALIEEYVARALPVGSRTLTENYDLGVSPATVRNELSQLEEDGYISQPHVSAGRIPTDFGYRAFVDDLLASGRIEGDPGYRTAVERLRQSASELDDLLESASAALARFTDCLSIVVAPSGVRAVVKQVTLISLSAHRAIVVVVTKAAQVYNRQMEFVDEVEPECLAEVQTFVNRLLAGRTLAEVEGGTDEARSVLEAGSSALARAVLDEVVNCLREHDAGHAHQIGMSSLMRAPEFQETKALIPLMQVLEDDAVLLQVLDPASTADGAMPSVRIGSENASERLHGVTVVASKYGRAGTAGIVAVIGPTRMDYSRVLQAVRVARAALEDD